VYQKLLAAQLATEEKQAKKGKKKGKSGQTISIDIEESPEEESLEVEGFIVVEN